MILDVYDDRSILHTKLAHASLLEKYIDPPEKIAKFPDDLFAVVMTTDSGQLRKFACVDKTQTALSALYLQETWKNLPAPAVKVAATNISTACDWYDLPVPPRIQKLANWNPLGLRYPELEKAASAGQIYPYVDVRGQKPAVVYATPHVEKRADYSQLVPISGSDDVSKAVRHFRMYHDQMTRQQKVAYCRQLVKEAEAIGFDVNKLPEKIRLFGSDSVNDPDAIIGMLQKRAEILPDRERHMYVSILQEKLASLIDAKNVDVIDEAVEKLAAIDHAFGIDRKIVEDPHQVFYRPLEKVAYHWRDQRHGFTVTEDQLKTWARDKVDKLAAAFNTDFVAQFVQQPVEFFDQLPDVTKRAMLLVAEG